MPPKRRMTSSAAAIGATGLHEQTPPPPPLGPFAAPATKTELLLFNKPLVQNAIAQSHWVETMPSSALSNGGNVVFEMAPAVSAFTDLSNAYLNVKMRVVHRNDNSAIADDADVFPVSSLLPSLFGRVSLSLAGTRIGNDIDNFPIISFFSHLLNYTSAAKDTILRPSIGHYKDLGTPHSVDTATNASLTLRRALIKGSREVEFCGRLELGFFTQERLLPNGVPITLTLERNDANYSLLASKKAQEDATPKGGFKILLTSCALVVRRVDLMAGAFSSINARLSHGELALYPYQDVESRSVQIPAGSLHWKAENVFVSTLPCRLLIGLCGQQAYLGNLERDPYIFAHNNVRYVNVLRDGVSVLMWPLEPDFERNNYLQSYLSVLRMLRKQSTAAETDLSFEAFKERACIFAVDLQADQTDASPALRGNLAIELRFSKAVTSTLTMICVGEFKRLVTCNVYRQFTVTDA